MPNKQQTIIGNRCLNSLVSFFKNEQGGTVIEYAMIGSLVSIAALTAMTAVGGQVNGLFNSIALAFR